MSHNAILAVISLLAEKWPSCFSIIESGRRPLKLGIRDDVLAALDGAISAGKVSAALRWYVSSPEYQRRLLHGAWRVDLNGRPAGTVAQERRSTCSRATGRDRGEAGRGCLGFIK